ncbi:MAG: hypothetical protein OEM52_02945 [bacterium]|nr:hypothetical protein [bacterium]
MSIISLKSTSASRRWWFATLLVAGMLLTIAGCAKYDGSQTANQLPIVEFATTPRDSSTFNAAPIISWFGRDPDGFVELYSYADIIDPAALANPTTYVPQIPRDAWKTTASTSDTVILLTSIGDTTQHIFYLKATDNRGGESPVIYRRFDRTNQPPNAPELRAPDDSWSNRVDITDTLFCIENTNDLWPGITFNWRGSDPDDRVDRTIALTYKYFLIKAPNDTIGRFVSQNWSTTKNIVLSGLETGSYRFEVYSRDDGLTVSKVPGVLYFSILRPTYDRNVLIYMEGSNARNGNNRNDLLHTDSARAYYTKLLSDIKTSYPEYQYLSYNQNEPHDVEFYIHGGALVDSLPPKILLSRYRVILWMQDVFPAVNSDAYNYEKIKLFREYLQVGGRMMIAGRQLSRVVFPPPANAATDYAIAKLAFFNTYFGVNLPYDATYAGNYITPNRAEFIGTSPAFDPFERTDFDSTRMRNLLFPFTAANLPYTGLPGVDYIERVGASRTVFTFVSNTDTLNPYVGGEDATVIGTDVQVINGQIVTYPPTPTNCLIQIQRNGDLESIDSVVNLTKRNNGSVNYRGEVRSITGRYAFISYPYGEPWRNSDTLAVYYYYRATSERHNKPVCTTYEATQTVGGTNVSLLLTRTVMCSYPWYFVNQTTGSEQFARMLNWLLAPPNFDLQ